jgi:hypothetical protein
MSRRNRGVKISLQELGTAFGGLRVAEFPTQSSEVDGTDRGKLFLLIQKKRFLLNLLYFQN